MHASASLRDSRLASLTPPSTCTLHHKRAPLGGSGILHTILRGIIDFTALFESPPLQPVACFHAPRLNYMAIFVDARP